MAKKTKIDLKTASDEQLLQSRVRDLNLDIQDSCLEPRIEQLYKELEAKNLIFRPECYLADEWLTPDKLPIIGIPFWLAHPRLQRIEQKMMYEVEGASEKEFMKLIRHECGHAINYAYKLYRKSQWREHFGLFSAKYSNSYYFRPYSKRYVIHLQDNYAQSHPDEDFAETFATWLAPDSNWEKRYQDWPVIKKLQYVDHVMKNISDKKPIVNTPDNPPWSASRMISTLQVYYTRRQKDMGNSFQGFYDNGLKKIFIRKHDSNKKNPASKFLRTHRGNIINNVTQWTGHRKYDIYQLYNRFISRCDALDLDVSDETSNIVAVTSLLTAIASDTIRTDRRFQQ